MKKLTSILSLGVAVGALGGSAFFLSQSKTEIVVKASTTETYIPMEEAFFTNWTNDAGGFAGTDATFWGEGYDFENLDTFYRGETAEGWKGTLTSRTWKQSTQFVYFQLGAAKDYGDIGEDETGFVHLVFHYGSYSADFYNNTFVENPLTLRYFKVPDDKFAELTAENSEFDMYVEIVDGKVRDYGFANFGYLHVNQTEESTSDAMRYFLNHLSTDSREWEVNKRKEIALTYFTNESQREVFYRAVNNIDETFDSQENFLNHWYFDQSYYSDGNHNALHFDKAISQGSVRPGDSQMPFNKTGSGFFRGWYENESDGGFVSGDSPIYRFISRPFVLSGDCIVSVKLAGTASLHVIDATVNPGNDKAADLAWIDNSFFSTSGDEILTNGFNTCTMVRHVVNLSAYSGRKVQLAICDYSAGGWGAAYFDDLHVNVNLESAGFQIEAPIQSHVNGTTYRPIYLDKYICTENITEVANGIKYRNGDDAIEDTSNAEAAYGFVTSFLSYARANNGQADICSDSIRKSDEMKALLNAYNALATSVKKMVCASSDYQRASGDWYLANVSLLVLGESIRGIAFDNNIDVTVYVSNNANRITLLNNGFSATFLVIGAIVVVLGLLTFIIFKKKRAHRA